MCIPFRCEFFVQKHSLIHMHFAEVHTITTVMFHMHLKICDRRLFPVLFHRTCLISVVDARGAIVPLRTSLFQVM